MHLYIDEYSHFGSSSTTAMFFKEARFLNIGTLASLQVLSDIKDFAHREALMNAGSLILFQLTGNDAEEIVKNLTVPPEEPKIDPRLFSITREPIDYLYEHEHENLAIQRLSKNYIRPIISKIEDPKNPRLKSKEGYLTYRFSNSFPNVLESLNNLLVDCMDDPSFIGTNKYYKRIIFILSVVNVYHNTIDEYLKKPCLSYIQTKNENDLNILKKDALYETNKGIWLNAFLNTLNDLETACKVLAKDPIRIPTGAIDIEQLGKQVKSFADRKGELAVKLATLPRYQAYCQTHDASGVPQEGIVRLFAPVPPPRDWLKIGRITQNSRQYMSKWSDVEQEIENRQAVIRATLQTTPPPKKTPDEPDTHPWVSRSKIFYPQ